jgi:hypothetical protein
VLAGDFIQIEAREITILDRPRAILNLWSVIARLGQDNLSRLSLEVLRGAGQFVGNRRAGAPRAEEVSPQRRFENGSEGPNSRATRCSIRYIERVRILNSSVTGWKYGEPGRTRTCNPLIKRPSKDN